MEHNSRSKSVFQAPEEGDALRAITFDEATVVAMMVTNLAINSKRTGKSFDLRTIIQMSMIGNNPTRPEVFARPVFQLVQRFVLLGAIVDVTLPSFPSEGLLSHRYIAGVGTDDSEWATMQIAAEALGLPYVAHRYGTCAVRVHAPRSDGDPGMGSGAVLAQNVIVTNRHVVEHAKTPNDILVSWGDSEEVPCVAFLTHDDPAVDLALVIAPGFSAHPVSWIRSPRAAEKVIVLAYPLVPQVYTKRPQLVFDGTVATSDPVVTHWGNRQSIINAVMPPGASGGPVFGRDGRLVGLIVESLEGQTLLDGNTLTSTLHAFIPGDVLLEVLPSMHPGFTFLNDFASADEGRAAREAFPNKWYPVDLA